MLSSEVHRLSGVMEDWAYASSWLDSLTNKHTQSCQPSTYGGYPLEKTEYNDSVLRCFNIQIKTGENNSPSNEEYGNSKDVLEIDGIGNGHGPRNIRLLLLTTDLVQPYVVLLENTVIFDKGILTADLKWKVGGALHVDEVKIFYTTQTNMLLRDAWSMQNISMSGSTILEHSNEHDKMDDIILGNSGRGVFRHRFHLGC